MLGWCCSDLIRLVLNSCCCIAGVCSLMLWAGGFEYPDGRSQQHNKCCIDIAGMSWSMQFDVVIRGLEYPDGRSQQMLYRNCLDGLMYDVCCVVVLCCIYNVIILVWGFRSGVQDIQQPRYMVIIRQLGGWNYGSFIFSWCSSWSRTGAGLLVQMHSEAGIHMYFGAEILM